MKPLDNVILLVRTLKAQRSGTDRGAIAVFAQHAQLTDTLGLLISGACEPKATQTDGLLVLGSLASAENCGELKSENHEFRSTRSNSQRFQTDIGISQELLGKEERKEKIERGLTTCILSGTLHWQRDKIQLTRTPTCKVHTRRQLSLI